MSKRRLLADFGPVSLQHLLNIVEDINGASEARRCMGDHSPKHVHVYKDGREVAKVEIPGLLVLKGKIDGRIRKILQKLIEEGEI